MIKKETRALRREKWITHPLWIYVVLICTVFLLIGGYSRDATYKLWFGIIACFWIIIGAVFFIKHLINCNRVELLKEIKEIQLQILELKEKIGNRCSE
jgi:undecaprenyl pyrophosphate phosphatase UppP